MASGELTEKETEDFQKAFELFDVYGTDTVPCQKLGAVMRALGHKPSESDVNDMVTHLDKDRRGSVDYSDFLKYVTPSLKSGKSKLMTEIEETFQYFDTDNSGRLSKDEVKQAMEKLGEPLTDKEMDIIIKAADINGDGEIELPEFMKLMIDNSSYD